MIAALFTDVNCPFCYATELRLEALDMFGQVEWRGVEHEPDLPVPMALDDDELAAELVEEVDSVRLRAPEVPIAVPPGKANTGHALLTVAAAVRADPGPARGFRHALYAAFWRDGQDISDPGVVDALARRHGFEGLELRPEDELRVASWRLDWARSPLRGIPLLVRPDGETVYGLKDVEVLERFLTGE